MRENRVHTFLRWLLTKYKKTKLHENEVNQNFRNVFANLFHGNVPFQYFLKTSEKQSFFDIFTDIETEH